MHPILFTLFGFKFYTYGALVASAFGIGTFWILQRARARGESDETYLEGIFWMIIASIVGARVCYLFFFPAQFFADPLGTLFAQGGLVWYGGMIGFMLMLVFFTRLKRLSLQRFADIVSVPAALGLAIGRIGCLMAGCCYGAPTNLPWAIHYPPGHETYPVGVHPTPIYESLSLLIVMTILLQLEKSGKQRFDGFIGWVFVILYGIVRFLIEYVRGDRLVWIPALNLSASQVISLCGIALGVVMLTVLRKKSQSATPPAATPAPQH